MKRFILAAGLMLAVCVPAVAQAKPPTPQHARAYTRAYDAVARKFGRRTAGCDLLRKRGSCHVKATDAAVLKSLGIFERDLAPPPPPAPVVSATSAPHVATAYAPTQVASSASVPVSGGTVGCIIQRESTNGTTSTNIAQFQQSTWDNYAPGAGVHASTPSAASYGDQEKVVSYALAHGGIGNWRPYDGC